MNSENISNISQDTGTNQLRLTKDAVLSKTYFLREKTIGVSISESEQLMQLGYGVSHLKDAIIEVARYILAAGGRLAYGGDMRHGGFTDLIFDLLAHYTGDKALSPHQRFFSYLAYPVSLNLSKEKEASLQHNVTFVKVDRPNDVHVENETELFQQQTAEILYVWARSLTKMRIEMNDKCDGRIFMGGRTKEFKGRMPGLLEEFLIASKKPNQPIYLVGAFGGITRDIIQALKGNSPESLKNEYYSDNAVYNAFKDLYNQKHQNDTIDYSTYLLAIEKIGIDGIAARNGLSVSENERLAVTPHIAEMVFLILKGLSQLLR